VLARLQTEDQLPGVGMIGRRQDDGIEIFDG
jgi:hypothetical protein